MVVTGFGVNPNFLREWGTGVNKGDNTYLCSSPPSTPIEIITAVKCCF
jgi:hypothetical protein